MKMSPEVKQLWVDALLSNEFEANNDGCLAIKLDFEEEPMKYDPLGVLCELAIRNGIKLTVEEVDSPREMACVERRYNGEDAHLPLEVMQWAGLDSQDPKVYWTREKQTEFLSAVHYYNEDSSFKEVANLIYEQL
jgi:hypothetical protein